MADISLLQIKVQRNGWPLPKYTEVDRTGPPHAFQFIFKVEVNGVEYLGKFWKASVKAAKSEAARAALEALTDEAEKAAASNSGLDTTRLAEFCNHRGLDQPVYQQLDQSGPPHLPKFRFNVTVDSRTFTGDYGVSIRSAKSEAAKVALQYLSIPHPTTFVTVGSPEKPLPVHLASPLNPFGSITPPPIFPNDGLRDPAMFGVNVMNSEAVLPSLSPFIPNTTKPPTADPPLLNQKRNANGTIKASGDTAAHVDGSVLEESQDAAADVVAIFQMAQRYKVELTTHFELDNMSRHSCRFLWGGKPLPSSDFFPRKKDAKIHAASLGLKELYSNSDLLENKRSDVHSCIEMVVNFRNVFSLLRFEESQHENVTAIDSLLRAFNRYLSPSKEMRRATTDLIRQISSSLDGSSLNIEKMVLGGAYGRNTPLVFEYGLEIDLISGTEITSDAFRDLKMGLYSALGQHIIIKDPSKEQNRIQINYVGIQVGSLNGFNLLKALRRRYE
ncbi:HLA class II histocompatibility antigen, DR beta 4 chain [Phlyctochytrium planicorne]|nr:HLA class II histocompatibility antigen, DR beta 4 chain [Phlyctochytrium planicorne]